MKNSLLKTMVITGFFGLLGCKSSDDPSSWSSKQVDKWFEADLYVAINDMEKFTADMQVDENVKECITHMVFQLGLPRLNKFKNFKQALIDGDIAKAQAEMKDSLWYKKPLTGLKD